MQLLRLSGDEYYSEGKDVKEHEAQERANVLESNSDCSDEEAIGLFKASVREGLPPDQCSRVSQEDESHLLVVMSKIQCNISPHTENPCQVEKVPHFSKIPTLLADHLPDLFTSLEAWEHKDHNHVPSLVSSEGGMEAQKNQISNESNTLKEKPNLGLSPLEPNVALNCRRVEYLYMRRFQ